MRSGVRIPISTRNGIGCGCGVQAEEGMASLAWLAVAGLAIRRRGSSVVCG